LFNSHGGNQGIGQVILETMGYWNPEVKIVLATWWKLAADELLKINDSGPGGIGHAGEFETSLMLLIAPELVDLDKAESRQNTDSPYWAKGDLIRGARASLYQTMKEMTPNGVFGDPLAGSEDKGQAISKLVTARLEELVSDLRSG
jgi:creatinine amidohydrolase